jgi:hypothetical protein
MKAMHIGAVAGMLMAASAHARVTEDVVNGCEIYGSSMGMTWQAVHEKHMTLEQLNEGIDRTISKQWYYKTMSEQQAVLDNPRYKGATATTVAVVETAECIRRRS